MSESDSFTYPGQHVYDGIIFPGFLRPEVLDRMKEQDFYHQSDTLVVTYPKAGTTWMQEIIYSLKEGAEASRSRTEPLQDIFPFLEFQLPTAESSGLDGALSKTPPRLLKSHLPVRFFEDILKNEDTCPKIVYVMRNPKDTLVSFFFFHKLIGVAPEDLTWDSFFDMFRKDLIYYGNMFDHFIDWWQYRDHPKVLFLKYEDILSDTSMYIGKVAVFLEFSRSAQEIEEITKLVSFKTMKSRPVKDYSRELEHMKTGQFFRKGEKGDWENYFNEEQSRFVDDLIKERLEKAGIYLQQ